MPSANAAYLSTTPSGRRADAVADRQRLEHRERGAQREGHVEWILYPDGARHEDERVGDGRSRERVPDGNGNDAHHRQLHRQLALPGEHRLRTPRARAPSPEPARPSAASPAARATPTRHTRTAPAPRPTCLQPRRQFTAPYSAPGAPTGLGRTGWDLSWTAPSDTGNGSGGITRYEVQCRRALNTTTTNTLTGNPPATYATLTHQHCKLYSTHGNFARVRAFNNIWGAYSGWFRLQ